MKNCFQFAGKKTPSNLTLKFLYRYFFIFSMKTIVIYELRIRKTEEKFHT